MKWNLKSFIKDTEGVTAIEFAFVGPILFLMIFGLIECGRLYFVRSNMQYAVDEAGRYAMVYKTAADTSITQEVTQHLIAMNPSSVTVTIQAQTINGKSFKRISVAHNFSSPVGALLNWGSIPLNVQSTVPVLP